MPAAVEDGLLRLCKAENSVLPPVGEELRTDHPLLGRRARNDESRRMQVYPSLRRPRVRQEAKSSSSTALRRYIVLGKMHKQLAPPLWPNLLTLARSIGVYLVRTCYTRCIIKKRPFAYAYYTHT